MPDRPFARAAVVAACLALGACGSTPGTTPTPRPVGEPAPALTVADAFEAPLPVARAYDRTMVFLMGCVGMYGLNSVGELDQERGHGLIAVYPGWINTSSPRLVTNPYLKVTIEPAGDARSRVTVYQAYDAWETFVRALHRRIMENDPACRTGYS